MKFFEASAVFSSERIDREELNIILAEKSESLFQKSGYSNLVVLADIRRRKATFVIATKDNSSPEKLLDTYMQMTDLDFKVNKIEEITTQTFFNLIFRAERYDSISSAEEIFNYLYIAPLHGKSWYYGETMIDTKRSYEEIVDISKKLLFIDTMLPELERILKGSKNTKVVGHPVHYIIRSSDHNARKIIYKNLLSALYQSGRIINKRYAFVDVSPRGIANEDILEALYAASEGGAVVMRFTCPDEEDSMFGSRNKDACSVISKICMKYKYKVQTIICLERDSTELKNEILLSSGAASFVDLSADIVNYEGAMLYLKAKAKQNNVRADKSLLSSISTDKMYTSDELEYKFDDWFSYKLRTNVYPQYKDFKSSINVYKETKIESDSYDKLTKMIGLTKAKKVIDQAVNYFKLSTIFASRGINTERPSMHMIFTGNPGTAKTTVARLFADIMKEKGMLTSGNFVEVGRADIVGKYVGSTAPLVKNAFKKAKGGVLFIDEAYSLVDDRDGLYGDEAINTIVQEMENNREDTIVVFAGYPDKMEGFLNKNPGLHSRIAFHIPFEDYNPDELCEIAQLIASEQHLNIDECAMLKLKDVFTQAVHTSDFGNGRFARNVVEKAKMAQANRLMCMDYELITDENISTLCAEDFEYPDVKKSENSVKIGFVA